MRELKLQRKNNRFLLPVAVLRPGEPADLTRFDATALLDTGATKSGIGPRPIRELGLKSYGKNRLRSATDEVFVEYYLFRIGLYTTEQLEANSLVSGDLPFIFDALDGFSWRRDGDFDVILGMDVLSLCDVNLSRDGSCRLIFS